MGVYYYELCLVVPAAFSIITASATLATAFIILRQAGLLREQNQLNALISLQTGLGISAGHGYVFWLNKVLSRRSRRHRNSAKVYEAAHCGVHRHLLRNYPIVN